MDIGTFLLMQSPSARPPQEVYARGVKRGFNVLTGGFGVPVERLAEFGAIFNRVVAEVKPPKPPRVGVRRAVYVTKDAAEQARRDLEPAQQLRARRERQCRADSR